MDNNNSVSFSTIVSNNLPEVRIIAGDTQDFTYVVSEPGGGDYSLVGSSASLLIFKYGDPRGEGVDRLAYDYLSENRVRFSIPGSLTKDKSGVYQQQLIIADVDGTLHVPAQGKIIIFPGGAG